MSSCSFINKCYYSAYQIILDGKIFINDCFILFSKHMNDVIMVTGFFDWHAHNSSVV